MAQENTADVTFSLSLDGGELDLRAIAQTIRDIETLLSDIEQHVRQQTGSPVHWKWGAGSELEVVASVNGASHEELERIVDDAQRGFEQAERAARERTRINWPESFGAKAQRSANNILKRLENLQSITVHAENRHPIKIEAAEIGETITSKKRLRAYRRVHSSVEGRLELISHRGKLRAAIKDSQTNISVQCTFPDEMVESMKHLFDKNVIAEGLVSYRGDGTPASITEISSVKEKSGGRPLIEFIGTAPNFTGDLSTEDFISKIRGHGNRS